MSLEHIGGAIEKVLKERGVQGNGIKFDNVPRALAALPNWVVWRTVRRDNKPTKVPLRPDGTAADSTAPSTWSYFEQVEAADILGNFSGIGFVFMENGGFVGVDLDGCRDARSGTIEPWAREIIKRINTYAEVSPSQTGVKLFLRGASPFEDGKGRKKTVDAKLVCGKAPGIEIYDRGRYFAVTGWRLAGMPLEPVANEEALAWLKETYWPRVVASTIQATDFHSDAAVVERARRYVSKIPGAVSGQHGHDATFHVACVLVLDFALPTGEARALLGEWNGSCDPQWSDKELDHKIASADSQPGSRGRLRAAAPERWSSIAASIPPRKAPPPRVEATITSVADSARMYLDAMRSGATNLTPLGLGEADTSLGGGVAKGEGIVIAARPSHGKSMLALQVMHQWAYLGIPSIVMSAEMSTLALGKRVLHFLADLPEEEWLANGERMEEVLKVYEREAVRSEIIAEMNSADQVAEQIEEAIVKRGARAAFVDYVQLLSAPGKTKRDQVEYTTSILKEIRQRHNIPMVLLCQMNREVEKRKKFIPVMSDLEHAGRLEQDADVIMFCVWPHKIAKELSKDNYQVWIAKNRNRPIGEAMVELRLFPHRQMVASKMDGVAVANNSSFAGDFDDWNDRKDVF